MALFHKAPAKRSCFIYHDESGVVGTSGVFIVGLLFVKDRKPIYQKITSIRQAAESEFGRKIKYWEWNFTK